MRKLLKLRLNGRLSGLCSNVFLVDNNGQLYNEGIREITEMPKFNTDYKLALKVNVSVLGKQKQVVKTYTFSSARKIKDALEFLSKERFNLIESVKGGNYQTKTQQLQKQQQEMQYQETTKIPLHQKIDDYWDAKLAKGIIREKTVYNYRCYKKKYIDKTIYAMKPWIDITVEDVKAIHEEMLKNITEGSAYSLHTMLSPIYQEAILDGIVEDDPTRRMKRPTAKVRELTYSEDEIKRVFNEMKTYKEPLYRGVFIFLLTGLRITNITKLKWDYIDFNKNILTIPPEHTKTKKPYVRELNQEMLSVLEEQKLAQQIKPSEYVFAARVSNGFIQNSAITRHWTIVLTNAKVPYTNLHQVRSMLVSLMLNEGATFEDCALLLDHSSTAITQKHYSGLKKERSAKAFEKLQGILGEV